MNPREALTGLVAAVTGLVPRVAPSFRLATADKQAMGPP
jgi:hypothetical protein